MRITENSNQSITLMYDYSFHFISFLELVTGRIPKIGHRENEQPTELFKQGCLRLL